MPLEQILARVRRALLLDVSVFEDVRDDAPFTKGDIVAFLEDKKIATRMLFSGNITKQPYFEGRVYRTVGPLPNADTIMTNTFWIGVYPGLTEAQRRYMADCVDAFFASIVPGTPTV